MRRSAVAPVDQTDARYGQVLNEKQPTENQLVVAVAREIGVLTQALLPFFLRNKVPAK
jgi:hypothetical protein